MKRELSLWVIAGLLTFAISAGGCRSRNESTASNRTDQTDRTVGVSDRNSDNQTSASDQKKAYENKVDARLNEFDNRLDQLRSRSNNSKEGMKAADQNVINDLNMKNEAAKKMLDNIKSADVNSWQDMRQSMDKTLADLENSYNKAGMGRSTASRGNERNTSSPGKRSDMTSTNTGSKNQSKSAEDQKNAYENTMGTQIDQLEKRLNNYQSNTDTKNNKTNAAVVDELKMKIDVARTILSHIKSADVATWHRMKGDLDHAVSDLDRSYRSSHIPGSATSSTAKSRRH